MTRFIAVDGEARKLLTGTTGSPVDDDYVLLCRSTGEHVWDDRPQGLKTITCLEFLLAAPKAQLVCFGLNYDVNQWLRDLPKPALRELWERHVTYWKDYRIEWVPGRWFTVKALDGRFARVNEVFGFYQSSFVKALRDWDFEPPSEMEAMKAARSGSGSTGRERVLGYCLAECDLLVSLMDDLALACEEADITPKQWIGAGSIATALLGRQEMDRHHAYDLDIASQQTVEDAILGAYFGGRVELLNQGVFSRVTSLDVRSAYPSAAAELPSLEGAKLVHRKRFTCNAPGIWRVSWDIRGSDTQLAPFPVRRKFSIFYPLAGTGFYHAVEVAAAIEAGYPVKVHEGWVLQTPNTARPFRWIGAVYRQRQKLKAEGHAAQKVVKLGLNSIYGKLAQGYGFNARPRWQSYFWAGQITATTRAKMLTIADKAERPLMIATDGIFCAGDAPRIRLSKTEALGSWEPGSLERLFTAQPGVYHGLGEGKEIVKSRGFFAREVDYDELRHGFEMEGAEYVHHYSSTRFNGLGASLGRRDFSIWRRWTTETRALTLAPERKQLAEGGALYPVDGPLESEPYQPKQSLIDARALDQLQGMDQPMREAI